MRKKITTLQEIQEQLAGKTDMHFDPVLGQLSLRSPDVTLWEYQDRLMVSIRHEGRYFQTVVRDHSSALALLSGLIDRKVTLGMVSDNTLCIRGWQADRRAAAPYRMHPVGRVFGGLVGALIAGFFLLLSILGPTTIDYSRGTLLSNLMPLPFLLSVAVLGIFILQRCLTKKPLPPGKSLTMGIGIVTIGFCMSMLMETFGDNDEALSLAERLAISGVFTFLFAGGGFLLCTALGLLDFENNKNRVTYLDSMPDPAEAFPGTDLPADPAEALPGTEIPAEPAEVFRGAEQQHESAEVFRGAEQQHESALLLKKENTDKERTQNEQSQSLGL